MPAAAPAAPLAAPATDVPRHVADLSDIQRCADSKKDDVMDRTDPCLYMRGELHVVIFVDDCLCTFPTDECSVADYKAFVSA